MHKTKTMKKRAPQTSLTRVKMEFPIRLHQCINENHGLSLRWIENGAAFTIFDMEIFARTILPRHFHGMTTTKFAHLLSIHEFKRSCGDTLVETEYGPQTKKSYTFHRAMFTKDARPSELIHIKPQKNYCKQFSNISLFFLLPNTQITLFLNRIYFSFPLILYCTVIRMKSKLLQTKKIIHELKNQMQNSQKECLTLVDRIKEQLRLKSSIENLISMEELTKNSYDDSSLQRDNNSMIDKSINSPEATTFRMPSPITVQISKNNYSAHAEEEEEEEREEEEKEE
jgi:hypothetical protein